jgi:hypothetical protein
MTLRRLLHGSTVAPEAIGRLISAYEQTLRELDLVDRDDPISEIVAKRIIAIADTGIRDPRQICKIAVAQLEPGGASGKDSMP